MTLSCNHDQRECVNLKIWPTWMNAGAWSPRRLTTQCRGYEESKKQTWEHIRRYCQPETLTDNETEFDPEEIEDEMNNLPSPKQQMHYLWTPEYQARREARKRLWSPPLTPPLPGMPSYPLQPSQRPPTLTRRRSLLHNKTGQSLRSPSHPPSSIQLHLPPKPQRGRICKARAVTQHHRPITRSMKSSNSSSLHTGKGRVKITSVAGLSYLATFEEYLRNGLWWSVTLASLY